MALRRPATPLSAPPGVGLAQEEECLFCSRTVEENRRLGGYSVRRVRGAVAEELTRAYDRFPILTRKPQVAAGLLSGGQQQMLAIAHALMPGPPLLVLDEPSAGLGPADRRGRSARSPARPARAPACCWCGSWSTTRCQLPTGRRCWTASGSDGGVARAVGGDVDGLARHPLVRADDVGRRLPHHLGNNRTLLGLGRSVAGRRRSSGQWLAAFGNRLLRRT